MSLRADWPSGNSRVRDGSRALIANTKLVGESEGAGLPLALRTSARTDQRASRRAFIKSTANLSSLMPRYPGHMAAVRPIMTGDEWAAAVIDSPPTPDDVTITLDGRRIDSKEKAIAWLAEIEADRAAGKTAADTFA